MSTCKKGARRNQACEKFCIYSILEIKAQEDIMIIKKNYANSWSIFSYPATCRMFLCLNETYFLLESVLRVRKNRFLWDFYSENSNNRMIKMWLINWRLTNRWFLTFDRVRNGTLTYRSLCVLLVTEPQGKKTKKTIAD